eukprot:gnl/TRDRNA2_/TRDRNA2_148165_c0_seq2.p1 gnl/TRDRNA2_/TRDRNA2_148165_c0~~gnl/TRDRNA2_/TRDRNA2_148165_c0_seq2.p1  ORF type:complete len:644 (+),score=71.28 gnl/TRDRNA2_/TRDRNA2_148165_c0_seq2:223-1932(+)
MTRPPSLPRLGDEEATATTVLSYSPAPAVVPHEEHSRPAFMELAPSRTPPAASPTLQQRQYPWAPRQPHVAACLLPTPPGAGNAPAGYSCHRTGVPAPNHLAQQMMRPSSPALSPPVPHVRSLSPSPLAGTQHRSVQPAHSPTSPVPGPRRYISQPVLSGAPVETAAAAQEPQNDDAADYCKMEELKMWLRSSMNAVLPPASSAKQVRSLSGAAPVNSPSARDAMPWQRPQAGTPQVLGSAPPPSKLVVQTPTPPRSPVLSPGHRQPVPNAVVVEKPVYVEKVVHKPVFVDRVVEKIVERPVYIDRVVEVPVHIDRATEKPGHTDTRYVARGSSEDNSTVDTLAADLHMSADTSAVHVAVSNNDTSLPPEFQPPPGSVIFAQHVQVLPPSPTLGQQSTRAETNFRAAETTQWAHSVSPAPEPTLAMSMVSLGAHVSMSPPATAVIAHRGLHAQSPYAGQGRPPNGSGGWLRPSTVPPQRPPTAQNPVEDIGPVGAFPVGHNSGHWVGGNSLRPTSSRSLLAEEGGNVGSGGFRPVSNNSFAPTLGASSDMQDMFVKQSARSEESTTFYF